MNKPEQALYVGIDVAKDSLEIAFHPKREHWSEANSNGDHLAKCLQEMNPQLIVMESSGGYERALFKSLQKAGLPVRLENAAHIFHYRKSLGRLVKTDRTDAQVIADYAAKEHQRLTVSQQVSESVEALRILVLRRAQLVEMHVMEHQHAKAPIVSGEVVKSCNRLLALLSCEIDTLSEQITALIQMDPLLCHKARLLQSIPGIGETTTAGLLAFLPELGHGNRKQMAALSGLVPYQRQSGKYKGKAFIQSGRHPIRQVLYMAALSAKKCNPAVKLTYDRLVSQGKPKKLALIACMHKLVRITHTLIKHNVAWQNPASA